MRDWKLPPLKFPKQGFPWALGWSTGTRPIKKPVDITSAVWEVIGKKPDISAPEAILSGLRVGRAAMGTMTTTLLLAYSGGYISLLMVFMAQGTPVDHILNYKYVAAEVLDTVVGSFGLVMVAPFTALMAGLLLTRRKKRRKAVSE